MDRGEVHAEVLELVAVEDKEHPVRVRADRRCPDRRLPIDEFFFTLVTGPTRFLSLKI